MRQKTPEALKICKEVEKFTNYSKRQRQDIQKKGLK